MKISDSTTFSITKLSIVPFSIATLTIKTFSITTLSILTFRIIMNKMANHSYA
jgi:hypothetical protein